MTSVLLSSARVPGPLTGLQNQLGLAHRYTSVEEKSLVCPIICSATTGNKLLDNLTRSVRKPVMDQKEEIEVYHQEGRRCSGAKGRTGPAGFTAVADNVSLEVTMQLLVVVQLTRLFQLILKSIRPKNNTSLDYQGKSLHMTQSMGYINRVKTGSMR